jgi:small subunit ribosomal protein S20
VANTPSAKKRARQNPKRALRNASHRSAMRTSIKKTLKQIADKKTDALENSIRESASLIDRIASKGIIHPNKAARLKGRLQKKVNLAQSA